MPDIARRTEFAPGDPTDGRDLQDWQSRYADAAAKKAINFEAWYLGILLAALPVGMLVVWLGYPQVWLRITDAQYATFAKYCISWISGTLGGTLFALKWLYHSVARQTWNADRRLWRIFTPHISGGLSFSVAALIASGLIRVFDGQALNSLPLTVGCGFLVGYFSDSAIAKLSEIAEILFGVGRKDSLKSQTSSPKTEQTD